MSALLEARTEAATGLEQRLQERVGPRSGPEAVAQAAAEVLAAELGRPVVSVFLREPRAEDLVLLGVAPRGKEAAPKGCRRKADRSVVFTALREGTAQRSLNYYVEPDFVRSLPGETRSALAVPIVGVDRVLGIVHLEYASPHAPSDADQTAAEKIAESVAATWSAADGLETGSGGSEGKAAEAAALLARLQSALAQSDDFATVLGQVPAAVVELLRCGGAALFRRHASRSGLEFVGGFGSLEFPAETLIQIDGTQIGALFLKGTAVEVSCSAEDDESLFPAGLLEAAPRDAILVPVTSAGKVAGLLVAVDSPADGFSSGDARLAQAFADCAGAAEALSSIGPLRQKISDASLVAEVGRAMTGTLGLDDVLALIVRSAEMLVSGRCAGVALLSRDQATLTLVAASGSLMTKTRTELPARETVVGHVASSAEIVITEALSSDARGWPLGDGFGPAVLVPLESHGQILGVLFAARGTTGEPIGDENVDAVRKLGAYAAIAIENARLYQEQKELSDTLKRQAQELEKAYSELRASQERLLVSEKMAALGRVTAGIAHEINSPLGSILNCLQLSTTYAEEYKSSAGDPDVTAEDHQGIASDLLDSLKLAEEATRRVAQFVRTIKGQTRMEEERCEMFAPAETTESTILMLQHELQGGAVSIESALDRAVQLRGDANKFAVITQNLISNAVHAYEGKEGVVHVRLRQEGQDAILEVEDRGSGIPEEVRPRVYDYLFTTKDIGQGTGLGLSLTHSVVTSHFNGKIDFQTETGVGTTFVVTIPLPADN